MMLATRPNSSNWMTNFFDDFFGNDFVPRVTAANTPAINVKEDADSYTMEFAAPGLKKEFCRVNIDNEGNLCVKMENKMEHKTEDKHEHYIRREFSYSNYEQTYVLPDNVNKEAIEAKVDDGVLKIKMPKLTPKEEAKVQKCIEVK